MYPSIQFHFQLYSWILLISTILALGIAIMISKRRDNLSVKYLVLLEIAVAIWSFAGVFEAAAPTVALKQLWSQISYIGITTSPVFYFLFALAYSQNEKYCTKRNHILLFIFPVLTIIVVATNSWHHLHWTNITINPETNNGIYSYGPFFWVFIVFAYSILLSGIIILIFARRHFSDYFKLQLLALIIASVFPFAGNVIYVFKINPIPGLDWTPVAFMLTGLILALSIFKFKMFNLIPIARNNIVDTINDGIIVIDNNNRIVDINRAILNMIPQQTGEFIGSIITNLPELWRHTLTAIPENSNGYYEVAIGEKEKKEYYDIHTETIYSRKNKKIGQIFIIRDISKRKQFELEREKLIEELQDALTQVKTLSGLLPICASCKKIRDDKGYWHHVEAYVMKHSDAQFSHSICPDCRQKLYPDIPRHKD
ncbi:PAS domain S-box protein [candidate division KSB1 bacterium]|nr:PAS domain S-box protein [candidate division KSB1 bacterium]